jgi:hypothetical protein
MLCLEIFPGKRLDIYSFFLRANAIICPQDEWFLCIQASLKRKQEVLIFERAQEVFPEWDSSKRWCVSQEWIWLAPRSLSFIKSEFSSNSVSFPELRDHLYKSK